VTTETKGGVEKRGGVRAIPVVEGKEVDGDQKVELGTSNFPAKCGQVVHMKLELKRNALHV